MPETHVIALMLDVPGHDRYIASLHHNQAEAEAEIERIRNAPFVIVSPTQGAPRRFLMTTADIAFVTQEVRLPACSSSAAPRSDLAWYEHARYVMILNRTERATEAVEAWPDRSKADTWRYCFKRREHPGDVWSPPGDEFVWDGTLGDLARKLAADFPERSYHVCEVVRPSGQIHEFRF